MSINFLYPVLSGLPKRFFRHSATLTVSTVLLGFSTSFSALKDITVISSSETEFHFIVNYGDAASGLDQQVGADSLLYMTHTIQIGIPDGARPRLVAAQGISSVPLNTKSISGSISNHRLASMPLAELSAPWTMRGREFVTVVVSPVAGDAIFRQVEIKVSFDGAELRTGSSSNDPKFNKIFASSIANWAECQNWSVTPRLASKSVAQPGPFSVFADWYKVAVNQNGIHTVTFDQLRTAGLVGSAVPSPSMFIYNSGGLQVNPRLTDPRPVFQQVAISIEDGGDGNFQSGDRILFYGESLNRWLYDSAGGNFAKNAYSTENIYWLAVSSSISETPLRMASINAAPTGTAIDTFNTYTHYIHLEQENLLRLFDGLVDDFYTWYWSSAESLDVFVPAANVVPGQTANIFIAAKTYDQTGSGDGIGNVDLSVNSQPGLSKSCNFDSCTYQTNSLISGLNRFSMRLYGFVSSTLDIDPHFDCLDLSYRRFTVPIGSSIDASFGPYSQLNRVDITDNFTAVPLVFNISNPSQPVRLIGSVRANGMVSFEDNFYLNSSNRFYAVASNGLINPVSITKSTPVDLYTTSSQADLIIVAATTLAPAMTEYVNYRSGQGISIDLVTADVIMDNFGFGLYDPSAIRDFLKHAYENYPAPAPSAVLFVGDANYDFLDHLGTGVPNFVPAYVFEFDRTMSDDNYVYFGQYGLVDSDSSYITGDRGFDMISARWPVSSASEINSIVAKLKLYESPANFDNWRTNITLATDDEIHPNPTSNPPAVEAVHTYQTEELSNNHIPNVINKNKIYAWEHPFVNREKPSVNNALVDNLNNGALVVNYVGHGSPDLWAHEHIFSRTADLPRLTNSNKLPLVFAASCAISFFDDPKREGMAEDLLVMNGGAIGVLAATRLVYSAENAAFNREMFDILLYNDSITICESLFAAKLLRQYVSPTTPVPNTNDRNYVYIGDPYLGLGMPRLKVIEDSTVDSFQALNPTRITGRITDRLGALYNSDGRLVVNVFDSERRKFHTIATTNSVYQYSVTGPTMFRGSATITNGIFDFTFIPPLDIGYGGSGARISLYAILDTIDAAGVIDSIDVGTTVATTTDSVGPDIGVTFSGKPQQPGGNVIQIGDQLEITLSDSSGINLAEGIGHGITLETDNNSSSLKNLTGLFNYNQDDYTSGSLNYNPDSLVPGLHTFKVKAWDNANNSATLEFTAEIITSSALAIQDLLNYPNPMADQTSFSFSLTQSVDRFSLEIFTLSGRKINSFNRYTLAAAYYDDIIWDGRDAYGDRVGTGVYLYKATAVPSNGDKVEEFGKVILINQ